LGRLALARSRHPAHRPARIGPFRSPLGRLLLHPAATLHRWWHELARLLVHLAHTALTGAGHAVPYLAGIVGLLAVAAALRRRAGRRRRPCYLRLLAPPEIDPATEPRGWAMLHDLLPPAPKRWLSGVPAVAFEYRWSAGGLQIGLWADPRAPVSLLLAAVRTGWPGLAVEQIDPPRLIENRAVRRAGALRLRRAEHYPLAADDGCGEPLAGLLAAAATSDPAAATVVQIVARPATGRTSARGRRAAAALRAGRRPRRLSRQAGRRRPPAGAPSPLVADPVLAGEITAVLRKAEDTAWQAAIRYAVTTSPPPKGGLRGRCRAWRVLAGRADALAAGFTVYTATNRLRRSRLPRPAGRINARRAGRTMWLSTAELASLAHLPRDPATPGLPRAGARPAPPPAAALSAALTAGGDGDRELTDAADQPDRGDPDPAG
jgi:hypothetical protein